MFSENVHAFLVASFYNHLVGTFPENGQTAFIFATEKYGEQRGSRMAQRAIRDNEELDFKSFNKYSEWSYTSEQNHSLCVTSLYPDYKVNVHKCPWHDQFVEMNCIEGAKIYCTYLDKSLTRGFNPRLDFRTTHNFYKNGYCELVQKGACLLLTDDLSKKNENVKTWEYHCAHLYFTFARVFNGIFDDKAESVINDVRKDFVEAYGEKMLSAIDTYSEMDFDYI